MFKSYVAKNLIHCKYPYHSNCIRNRHFNRIYKRIKLNKDFGITARTTKNLKFTFPKPQFKQIGGSDGVTFTGSLVGIFNQ